MKLDGPTTVCGAAQLAGLPTGWRDQLDWHDLVCAHAVVGHLHALRGEWAAAETALRASLTTFDRIGLVEGKKIPLEHLLWIAVRRGEPGRVAGLLAELDGAGPDVAADGPTDRLWTESGTEYELSTMTPTGRVGVSSG